MHCLQHGVFPSDAGLYGVAWPLAYKSILRPASCLPETEGKTFQNSVA